MIIMIMVLFISLMHLLNNNANGSDGNDNDQNDNNENTGSHELMKSSGGNDTIYNSNNSKNTNQNKKVCLIRITAGLLGRLESRVTGFEHEAGIFCAGINTGA